MFNRTGGSPRALPARAFRVAGGLALAIMVTIVPAIVSHDAASASGPEAGQTPVQSQQEQLAATVAGKLVVTTCMTVPGDGELAAVAAVSCTANGSSLVEMIALGTEPETADITVTSSGPGAPNGGAPFSALSAPAAGGGTLVTILALAALHLTVSAITPASTGARLNTYNSSALAYLAIGTPTMQRAACQQLLLFKFAVAAARNGKSITNAKAIALRGSADAVRALNHCVAPN